MNPLSSASHSPEPPMIGRYEVHEEIGRGSTGIVYLARDPLIGRWVALKTLGEQISLDDEGIEALRRRLINEAQSAGALSHPGIVAIHDVIEHGGGRLSIAGEYVEGSDLCRRLASPEPLPLEFIASVMSEVGEALDYAHSRGVVHRDLKPANILLGSDGTIKVTDFGIASLRDRDLADELRNLGSPNYLAPERILGHEAEARSDIYALGVVLYEMLTRNPPFGGDSVAELARNIVQERPAPVDHYRPDVFPEVVELLDRALAKEPADRPDTAGELARDFRRALDKRARHNDTVPTPALEELELAPPEETGEEAATAAAGEAWPTVPEEPSEAPEPVSPGPSSAPSGDGFDSPAGADSEDPSRVSPAVAAPPPRAPRRRPYLYLLPILLGLSLAAAAVLGGRWKSEGSVEPPTVAIDPAGADQMEYLRLLAESRRLFAEGDHEAAQRLLDQAERMSPAAARIRRMRDTARGQAEAERRALAEADLLDHIDQARADVEAGRLRSAALEVDRALELDPANEDARRLRQYIARLHSQRLERERSRQAAAPVDVPAAPEEEGFRPFTAPAQTPEPVSSATDQGDLRIDFYSEKPRGVLTIYADSRQVLNRPFRFFEKMKMLRRKGVSGGFDERAEVAAGDLELRIYLTLPEEETQLQTVTGSLPAGSLRTLRVRVDAGGALTTELH